MGKTNMKIKSKILVIFLVLAVLLSVASVSASEINETSQRVVCDDQDNVVLESNSNDDAKEDAVLTAYCDEGSDDVVLKASGDNATEPILARVVSDDLNNTVVVNGSTNKDVKSPSAEPVLKSSSGKIKKLTFNSKYNKYVTKKVGKYKIQVYKWKGYSLGGLRIYIIKNGKYLKRTSFSTRAYFKMNGKWRWSSWSHASEGFPSYHHYDVSNSVKITKVQVKFRYR